MSLRNKLMISAMAVVIGMATVSCKTVPKAQHINARSDSQCTTTTTSVTTTTTTTATTELRTTTTETTTTSTSTETEVEVATISDVAIETEVVETTWWRHLPHRAFKWVLGRNLLQCHRPRSHYSTLRCSGNQLVEGYSVACDSLPFGTLVYLDSNYISGTFRVDDCGTGSMNTIDVYYWDDANVPYDFAQAGRVPVTITILE